MLGGRYWFVLAGLVLGFTLASFNLDRIRSFRAKHHLDEAGQVTGRPRRVRAKRRPRDQPEFAKAAWHARNPGHADP